MKATKQTTNGTTEIANWEDEQLTEFTLRYDKQAKQFTLHTRKYLYIDKEISHAEAVKLLTKDMVKAYDIKVIAGGKNITRAEATRFMCRVVETQGIPGLRPVATKDGVLLKLPA